MLKRLGWSLLVAGAALAAREHSRSLNHHGDPVLKREAQAYEYFLGCD